VSDEADFLDRDVAMLSYVSVFRSYWTPAAAFVVLVSVTGCGKAERGPSDSISQPTADETGVFDSHASDVNPAEVYTAPTSDDQQNFAAAEPQAMAERQQSAAMMESAGDTPPTLAPKNYAMRAMSSAAPRSTAGSEDSMPAAAMPEAFENLPGGATFDAELGYATVQVFYATDRAADPVPLSSYSINGARGPVIAMLGLASICGFFALVAMFRGKAGGRGGALAAMGAFAAAAMALLMLKMGVATIEKEGVTYTGQRGVLQRGIATVTVPDSHQRGEVERPSLLRFEFREDQSKHIVMTSATEITEDDFYHRLSSTVTASDEEELMVFIHGFNVDFDDAVLRTAQLAVDLPFRGVPVCYSWPSQGELLGYTVDENNVAWTVAHLKTFLYELAEKSDAKSINVIAHSMGNRALTSALSEISFELGYRTNADGIQSEDPLFDRVVLAAPDIDADYFRRDLAPRVLKTANNVTLYASSDDNALIASKQVHGYPRAGESGPQIVIVPGIETIDVTGIDLSLLGHSYYGDNGNILRDLFELVNARLPASQRALLKMRELGGQVYWQLTSDSLAGGFAPPVR
jgi:esterase/lipase superfamily enzyme